MGIRSTECRKISCFFHVSKDIQDNDKSFFINAYNQIIKINYMHADLSRDTCTSIYKVIDNFVHRTLMPSVPYSTVSKILIFDRVIFLGTIKRDAG